MGLLSDPIVRFRQDLADSAAVREVLGIEPTLDPEADAERALERIYLDGLPPPPAGQDAYTGDEFQALRPYIIVYPSESEAIKIRVASDRGCINASGQIHALISLPYTETQDEEGPTSVWLSTVEQVDKILRTGDPLEPGILDYLGREGRLQVNDLEVMMIGRTPVAERIEYGDCYDVMIVCSWGVT